MSALVLPKILGLVTSQEFSLSAPNIPRAGCDVQNLQLSCLCTTKLFIPVRDILEQRLPLICINKNIVMHQSYRSHFFFHARQSSQRELKGARPLTGSTWERWDTHAAFPHVDVILKGAY